MASVRPELIKIDVEGAEAQVLAGMLDAHRPLLVAELHAWPQVPLADNAEQILRLLSRMNYRMVDVGSVRVVNDGAMYADVGTIETSVQAPAQVLLLDAQQSIPAWIR